MAREKVSDDKRMEILEMTKQEMKPVEIGKELELAPSSVYRILQEENVRPAKQYSPKSYRKLSEDEIAAFLDRYDDFEPILELLDDFSMTHTQMYQLLEERDITPRMRRRETKEARSAALEHALLLYQESNLTINEITTETGVQQPVLHAQVHARNIPLRRPRKKRTVKYAPESTKAAEAEVDADVTKEAPDAATDSGVSDVKDNE